MPIIIKILMFVVGNKIRPINIIVLLMNEMMKYIILELKDFDIMIILINDIVEISNLIHRIILLFIIRFIMIIIMIMVIWVLVLFINLIKLYLYFNGTSVSNFEF